MKHYILVSAFLFFISSCNNDEKKAADLLKRAEVSYKAGNFNDAKMQIDSIRTNYPKAFDARKAAISLKQQIDLEEQRRSLAYLDSMMTVRQAELDAVKNRFTFEKDAEYQETGNYFYPTQTVEKNIGRTFLRASVNEFGEMSLTSIYCAGGKIHHKAVKVSMGDEFAQTPPSNDSYETVDLGRHIEKADYRMGNDGGVIGFILAHKDAKSLKLEFIGDRTFRTVMYQPDIKAITEVAGLAQILASMEQIRKEQKEANLKMQFVNKKIEETAKQEINQE